MSKTRMLSRPHKQAGITLVELIVSIVILAIALPGITAAISSGIGRSADVMLEARAVALAQSYLDEILSKRFDEYSAPRGIPPCSSNGAATCRDEEDFGPGGRTRDQFFAVDHYHDLDEGQGAPDPLRDSEGFARTGYDNFRVRVNVRYLDTAGEEENLGGDPTVFSYLDAKLITVTVSHRSNTEGWKFSAYKANF